MIVNRTKPPFTPRRFFALQASQQRTGLIREAGLYWANSTERSIPYSPRLGKASTTVMLGSGALSLIFVAFGFMTAAGLCLVPCAISAGISIHNGKRYTRSLWFYQHSITHQLLSHLVDILSAFKPLEGDLIAEARALLWKPKIDVLGGEDLEDIHVYELPCRELVPIARLIAQQLLTERGSAPTKQIRESMLRILTETPVPQELWDSTQQMRFYREALANSTLSRTELLETFEAVFNHRILGNPLFYKPQIS